MVAFSKRVQKFWIKNQSANNYTATFTINPFSINVPLLYPLKTSENRGFSYVFRGYRSGTLVENGLYENQGTVKIP